MAAELVDVRPDGAWKEPFAAGTLRVTAVLGFVGRSIEMRLAPDRPGRGGRAGRGQLNILPPDIPAWEHASDVLHLRRLALHFDVATLGALAGRPPSFAASPALLMFEDSRIRDLAGLLAGECETALPLGDLYAECVVAALTSAVQAHLGAPTPTNSGGGLTPRNLKRIEEFVEAFLPRQIRLGELAALTGFSESHFYRAFKVSTGSSPHRWLQERRVRRAQALILGSALPLAQIALETGFVDQGHLTRVFKSVTGATPAAWRRENLGRAAPAPADRSWEAAQNIPG
ncbi:MAG: AraC family transcriptional regulator [Rhizomicrobium sp.]